jgi:hypothetical protein
MRDGLLMIVIPNPYGQRGDCYHLQDCCSAHIEIVVHPYYDVDRAYSALDAHHLATIETGEFVVLLDSRQS